MRRSDIQIINDDRTPAEKRWCLFLDLLCEKLRERCKNVKSSAMYWSDKFSEPRCEKHQTKYSYGDCSSEEDGQRFCEKCGRILDHAWTNWGVDSEIGSSADEEMAGAYVDPEEAFTLLRIIECGNPRLTERCGDWTYNPEMKGDLRFIAKRLRIPKGDKGNG